MTALLLRALWKPVALLLALLGIYAKGRSDASAKERAKADMAALDTVRRIEDAKDAAASGGAGWHDRLRQSGK